MAKGATSKSNHCLILSLFILLSYLGTTLADGTDSLSCELTFNYRNLHGQCSVNGKTLLDFGDKKHEENATKMCAYLSQNLTEISEEMWRLQSGNDALNVTTKSQYNQGEFIDGFWAINTDEQHSIYFYPLNMTWRESHSDNSSAMEQWKNKNLEKDMRNVLITYFSRCLNKSSPHFREMPSAPCCSSSSAVLITSYNHVTLQHIPVASPAKETYF